MRQIDADALAKFIDYGHLNNPNEKLYSENDIREMIDMMPTIDAVPVRHGMWLPKHHYIAGHEFVSGHICSECGDDALNAEGDEFLTDYCPHCGARMDGTQRKPCDDCQQFDCYGCEYAERKEE